MDTPVFDQKLLQDWKQLLLDLHKATGLKPDKIFEIGKDVLARFMFVVANKGQVLSITLEKGEMKVRKWPMPKGHMKPFPEK